MRKLRLMLPFILLNFHIVWGQEISSALNGNYSIPNTKVAEANTIEIEGFKLIVRSIYEEVYYGHISKEEFEEKSDRRLSFLIDVRDSRPDNIQAEIEKQFYGARLFYFDKNGDFIVAGQMGFDPMFRVGGNAISDNVRVPKSVSATDISVYLAFEYTSNLSGATKVVTFKIK